MAKEKKTVVSINVDAVANGANYIPRGTHMGCRFPTFDDFTGGCNSVVGYRLHSFQLLLRAGAIEPQVYAVFIKE